MMNTGGKLPAKSKAKLNTARKVLRDVSNDVSVSTRSCIQKKLPEECEKERMEKSVSVNHDGSLNRLRLIHANLTSLVHQIDELMGQAINLTDREGIKEIDAFANVLHEMQTSLEPWVPRFQKALSNLSTAPSNLVEKPVATTVGLVNDSPSPLVKSPEETELVSPSPLVSWRAECIDRDGRQLFLLTPLPQQKEQHASLDVIEETKKAIPKWLSPRKPASPETCQRTDRRMLVMTPSLNVSPPKSCVLLEPISRFPQKNNPMGRKSTPFPIKVHNFDVSDDSESSSSGQALGHNKPMQYPEFLEIGLGYNYGNRRRAVEESPNWLLSPPKTCVVLMEPSDKEPLEAAINDHLLPPKQNELCKKGVGSKAVECTPMLLDSAYTIRTGKQKGENTLKKELWAKFEAVSETDTSQTTSRRGFLELLDEVS